MKINESLRQEFSKVYGMVSGANELSEHARRALFFGAQRLGFQLGMCARSYGA